MKAAPDPLLRHLALAIALKLAVLVALWWAFVRDERVGVDVERTASHLGAAVGAPTLPLATRGAQP